MLIFFILGARFRRKILPLLRVAGVLVAAHVVLALFFLHRAEAAITEAFLAASRPFLSLPGMQTGSEQSAQMNGAEFRAQSMSVPLPWRRVLNAAAKQCGARGGLKLDAEVVKKLAAEDTDERAQELLSGVLRLEGEGEGILVCLEADSKHSLQDWTQKLHRFAQTRDLALLGRPRYVRVQRSSEGASVLLTVWAVGDLNFDHMFPKTADAPGRDSDLLPRPPESRRLLSAQTSAGLSLASYESHQKPDEILSFYKASLAAANWSVLAGRGTLSATRADQSLRLEVGAGEAGTSFVTLSIL